MSRNAVKEAIAEQMNFRAEWKKKFAYPAVKDETDMSPGFSVAEKGWLQASSHNLSSAIQAIIIAKNEIWEKNKSRVKIGCKNPAVTFHKMQSELKLCPWLCSVLSISWPSTSSSFTESSHEFRKEVMPATVNTLFIYACFFPNAVIDIWTGLLRHKLLYYLATYSMVDHGSNCDFQSKPNSV